MSPASADFSPEIMKAVDYQARRIVRMRSFRSDEFEDIRQDLLLELVRKRFPLATCISDVIAALTELVTTEHPYQTVVIDTLDRLEWLIWDAVCREYGVESIETGRAIIMAQSPLERSHLFNTYVLAGPEPVTSSFREEALGTWILRLLAQVHSVHDNELLGVIANTYGGYIYALTNPAWQKGMEVRLAELMPRMLSAGLIERNGGNLQLTLLGKACGGSSLTFESVLRLVELLGSVRGKQTPEMLMAIVQALPELDDQYTPLFRKGTRESEWARRVGSLFGNELARTLQRYADNQMAYYARSKRVCILHDWINGVPTSDMERGYTINHFQGALAGGDIRAMADTTRFHLRSAAQIASIILPADAPEPAAMDALLRQLEVGIPGAALDLLDLPIPLMRGEYLSLIRAGVLKPPEMWSLAHERLIAILGAERVGQLGRYRPA